MALGFPFFRFTKVAGDDNTDNEENPTSSSTTDNPGGAASSSAATSSVVTTQPGRLNVGGVTIQLGAGDGVNIAEQVSQIVSLVGSIIEHPRTQRGCTVCYDQCSDPFSRHCGTFGRWFCACFKACCIIESTSTSNIPEVVETLRESYGPISLGLALTNVDLNLWRMVQNGEQLTEEQQIQLEEACKKAKRLYSGGMQSLSQELAHTLLSSIPDNQPLQEVLPILLGIIGSQQWTNPEHTPNPPPCWLIDTKKNASSSANDEDDRSSSIGTGIPCSASASKYRGKIAQKFLSNLTVMSLLTGQIGTLGFEKAHLIVWIFEKFLTISAGPNSPLIKSGGCPAYELGDFIRLLMLILLCCGYIPVDSSGKSQVDVANPEDPFMKIFLRAQRIYQSRAEALLMSASTSSSTSKKPLTRQASVRSSESQSGQVSSPADDYQAPEKVRQQEREDRNKEGDNEIHRQEEVLANASQLTKLFAAIKLLNDANNDSN
ncbi:hypothetical protein BOKEGFJH_00114 [Chlamydia avium]|nr:hypothetical protein BOKEGFJH_00114 [Chlamydia avium]